MDSDTIYDVVKKLAGSIEPIGETETDNRRLKNLEITMALVDRLLNDICQVSQNNESHMYSVKQAGEKAYKFLGSQYDEIAEYINVETV